MHNHKQVALGEANISYDTLDGKYFRHRKPNSIIYMYIFHTYIATGTQTVALSTMAMPFWPRLDWSVVLMPHFHVKCWRLLSSLSCYYTTLSGPTLATLLEPHHQNQEARGQGPLLPWSSSCSPNSGLTLEPCVGAFLGQGRLHSAPHMTPGDTEINQMCQWLERRAAASVATCWGLHCFPWLVWREW